MKIRNGFVSNSSSSSFIVAFNKQPKSIEDVKNEMFPDNDLNSLINYYDYNINVVDVCTRIFRDIQTQEKKGVKFAIYADVEKIKDFFSHYDYWKGSLTGIDDKYEKLDEKIFNDLMKVYKEEEKWSEINWKEYHRLNDLLKEKKITEEEFNKFNDDSRFEQDIFYEKINLLQTQLGKLGYNKFMEDNEGKIIYYFHFSDNDGEQVLEHGDIFNNLTNIRISHH